MKKKKEKLYKVGELVACVNENGINRTLGIITKSLQLKQGNMYDISWTDDFVSEELWDQGQVARFKEVLKQTLQHDKGKLQKG
jgi:hypothetical protein